MSSNLLRARPIRIETGYFGTPSNPDEIFLTEAYNKKYQVFGGFYSADLSAAAASNMELRLYRKSNIPPYEELLERQNFNSTNAAGSRNAARLGFPPGFFVQGGYGENFELRITQASLPDEATLGLFYLEETATADASPADPQGNGTAGSITSSSAVITGASWDAYNDALVTPVIEVTTNATFAAIAGTGSGEHVGTPQSLLGAPAGTTITDSIGVPITGLAAATTYYFRLIARNNYGDIYYTGAIGTFATAP